MILLEKEKFFLVDISKEEYQNYCKRRICLDSVLGFFVGLINKFLPDEPQGALVVKVSYLERKIVAIFPSNIGIYLTCRKKLILETKEILSVQGSQDLKELGGRGSLYFSQVGKSNHENTSYYT